MKNLLGLLSASSLVATSSASVTACGTKSENEKLTIEQKIEKFNNFPKEELKTKMNKENQAFIVSWFDIVVLGYEILQEQPNAELDQGIVEIKYINSKKIFLDYLEEAKIGMERLIDSNTSKYIEEIISKYQK